MSRKLMGGKDDVVALKHSADSVLHPVASRRQPVSCEPVPREQPLDFAQVYATHFDFVWRSLRLLGVPQETVEDVVQDTFDVVARQLPGFEGRSSLRTWIFSIAQRLAANHRRMARRKLQRLQPLTDEVSSAEPTPHAHAEAAEAAHIVERFVEGLEPRWRAVFVLSVLEGVPGAEVSALMGIPVNTVYSRVRTLRDELRNVFERHEGKHGRP